MRRIIFMLLLFLWMAVIYWYSDRPSGASLNDSGEAGEIVGGVFYGFSQDAAVNRQQFSVMIERQIRKIAHAIEFGILGFLCLMAFCEDELFAFDKAKDMLLLRGADIKIIMSFLVAAAYAASDELHQFFVPGRAALMADVVLDSVSAGIGISVGLVLWEFVRSKKELFCKKKC